MRGVFTPNGSLSLEAHVYDQAGSLLADVQDGKPYAVGNVCVKRPNLSTFSVEDFHRNELLYVRYLNPKAIEVRGAFAYPKRIPVHISADVMKVGAQEMRGPCMGLRPWVVLLQ